MHAKEQGTGTGKSSVTPDVFCVLDPFGSGNLEKPVDHFSECFSTG
jgi:hypothetical protein